MFDGDIGAFERVLQLSDIPPTRAPIASGHPSPRGEGVMRRSPGERKQRHTLPLPGPGNSSRCPVLDFSARLDHATGRFKCRVHVIKPGLEDSGCDYHSICGNARDERPGQFD